jgi:hypothetical protein
MIPLIIKELLENGFEYIELDNNSYSITNFYQGEKSSNGILVIDPSLNNFRIWNSNLTEVSYPCNNLAELISYHYYHYYLENYNKNISLSANIVQLYNDYGLLNKDKENRNKRLLALVEKINKHYSYSSRLNNLKFWQELAKEYPECVYTGKAFRAVIAMEDELSLNELKSPGYCWALNKNGIFSFIQNGDVYCVEADVGFYLSKAIVKGISLVHLYQLIKNTDGIESEFVEKLKTIEEEIISLEVLTEPVVIWIDSWKKLFNNSFFS